MKPTAQQTMTAAKGTLPSSSEFCGEFHFEDKVVSMYMAPRSLGTSNVQLFEPAGRNRKYIAKSEVLDFGKIEKFQSYKVSASQTIDCWRFKADAA